MLDVRDMFGSLRLSSEKQDRKKCQCNLVPKVLSAPKMAEEVSKTGLLEGTQPRPGYVVPDNPNNEALFHEKGKSPKEVRILYSTLELRAETKMQKAQTRPGWGL